MFLKFKSVIEEIHRDYKYIVATSQLKGSVLLQNGLIIKI